MNRELHALPPEQADDIADGGDTWWSDYKESNMAENNRISLKDDLQHKWFSEALAVLQRERLNLSDYDNRFLRGLEDGYNMFGRQMSPTRKQMEHLRQVAFDFEKGA